MVGNGAVADLWCVFLATVGILRRMARVVGRKEWRIVGTSIIGDGIGER